MTVSTQINKVQYNGPGTGPFTITYPFLKDTDILVVKTDSSGTDTTLILNTDFTVSGAGNPSGGELNLTTPLSASDRITIVREVELVQEVDYLPNDKFPAETHEEALDRLTMITQQLDEKVTRAVILPVSATSGDLVLPGTVPYGIWRWDQIGNAIEFVSAAEAFAGSPPLSIALGGTGADNASAARDNLGLTIGSSVQGYSHTLNSIAPLGTTANRMLYTTALNTWAEATLTPFARTLLDDSDAATARSTLGLAIGSNVQAYSPTLNSIAPLGTGANKLLYTTALNTWAESNLTSFARTLLDDEDAGTMRATLGLGTLATQNGTFSGTSSGTNTGDQNLFSTIAVSGQNSIVAGSTTDTLNLVAGTNVTITTDDTTNEITITASGGSGGSGDVSGPVASTVGAIAVWDDTSGSLLKDSNILVGSGSLSGLGEINNSTSLDVNTNIIVTDGNDADAGASISLSESTNSGSNLITLKAPDIIGTSATYTLPSTNTNGVLTNTAGTLSWEPSGGGGGGGGVYEMISKQVVTNLDNVTSVDFIDDGSWSSYHTLFLTAPNSNFTRLQLRRSSDSTWVTGTANYKTKQITETAGIGKTTVTWTGNITGSDAQGLNLNLFDTKGMGLKILGPFTGSTIFVVKDVINGYNGLCYGTVVTGAGGMDGIRFLHAGGINIIGTHVLYGLKLY